MNTYKFVARLTQEEKAKLLKIKQALSKQLNLNISTNETIKILINEKELINEQESNIP